MQNPSVEVGEVKSFGSLPMLFGDIRLSCPPEGQFDPPSWHVRWGPPHGETEDVKPRIGSLLKRGFSSPSLVEHVQDAHVY